ncbi:hypothetical protein ACIA6C_29600 [Streptomyces sp. NPDC051578]|uniref:hypothetical protein n=1 Tax=Streptomyces sp. NPDC051578 TaxID=3365662 RepID=UPI0037A13C83
MKITRVVPALMLPAAVLMMAAPAHADSPVSGLSERADVSDYAKVIADTTATVLANYSLIAEAEGAAGQAVGGVVGQLG